MDFELNEDQQMLAQTVADFTKKESPVERYRKMRDSDLGWDPKVWKHMGELGWLSVPFPESVGGYGGSFVECALILEQLGKSLVPEPYLASVVLGGLTILRAGNAEQHQKYLAPMIAGDTSLALAYAERDSRYDVERVATKAEKSGGGYVLSGEKVWVLNGHAADHLVVSAQAPGGLSLFVVPKGAKGLTVRRGAHHRRARRRLPHARQGGGG
jgi:alkylation response protein AidB-like acyl-CoA dehydrogenase